MAKKNKKQDSIDVDPKLEIINDKKIKEKNIENIPFYLKYKIPIFSSFIKIKNKYYSEDKKMFYLFLSLIIFALISSITLIVCGALWVSGAFGVNTNNSEESIFPGLLMAFGFCILIVV